MTSPCLCCFLGAVRESGRITRRVTCALDTMAASASLVLTGCPEDASAADCASSAARGRGARGRSRAHVDPGVTDSAAQQALIAWRVKELRFGLWEQDASRLTGSFDSTAATRVLVRSLDPYRAPCTNWRGTVHSWVLADRGLRLRSSTSDQSPGGVSRRRIHISSTPGRSA